MEEIEKEEVKISRTSLILFGIGLIGLIGYYIIRLTCYEIYDDYGTWGLKDIAGPWTILLEFLFIICMFIGGYPYVYLAFMITAAIINKLRWIFRLLLTLGFITAIILFAIYLPSWATTPLNIMVLAPLIASFLGLFGKFTPSDGKGMRTNSKRVYVKNLGQNMKGEDIIEIRKK